MFKTKNIIYISILVIFAAVSGIVIFYCSKFFADQINGAFVLDESRIQSSATNLDLQGFAKIEPRLP